MAARLTRFVSGRYGGRPGSCVPHRSHSEEEGDGEGTVSKADVASGEVWARRCQMSEIATSPLAGDRSGRFRHVLYHGMAGVSVVTFPRHAPRLIGLRFVVVRCPGQPGEEAGQVEERKGPL